MGKKKESFTYIGGAADALKEFSASMHLPREEGLFVKLVQGAVQKGGLTTNELDLLKKEWKNRLGDVPFPSPPKTGAIAAVIIDAETSSITPEMDLKSVPLDDAISKILDFQKENKGKQFDTDEVSRAIGIDFLITKDALYKLHSQGRIKRITS